MNILTRAELPQQAERARPAAGVPWYRLWAVVGVLFLILMAITQGRWIASASFRPSPTGSDPMPASQYVSIYLMQGVSFIWAVAVLWLCVLRPLRRTRRLSIDGKIALAMATCWWLDAMYNYVQITWYYNAHAVNMGSWGRFIPGSVAVGQEHFPEPILNAALLWFCSFVTFAYFGSRLYGKLRARLGPSAFFLPAMLVYLSFLVEDTLFQNAYIRSNNFGYAATWGKFTLFAGTRYQYPLYEATLWSVCLIALTLLRSHLDTNGDSAAERGLRGSGMSLRAQNWCGFLAVTGFCQTIVLFGWMLPYQMFTLQVDTFAPLPSYLRAGMCGHGAPNACSDGSFGIPTVRSSPEFAVRPDDPRFAPATKAAQGAPRG